MPASLHKPDVVQLELQNSTNYTKVAVPHAARCTTCEVLLRLPHELKDMFQDWLTTHAPLKAQHVLNQIRDTRGGQLYDNRFGVRVRGVGRYASLIQKRFDLAIRRLEYTSGPCLDTSCFMPPTSESPQTSLF